MQEKAKVRGVRLVQYCHRTIVKLSILDFKTIKKSENYPKIYFKLYKLLKIINKKSVNYSK